MKKILKNPLFTFIIGLILAGSIGVIAVSINANQIDYVRNGETIKLNTYLDTLYNNLSTKIALNTFGELKSGELLTTQKSDDQFTNLTLIKGKYIVIASTFLAGGVQNKISTTEDYDSRLSCDSCAITKLFGKGYRKTGTSSYTSGWYFYENNQVGLYYIEVTGDEDTLSLAHANGSTHTNTPVIIALNAIPINE